MSTIRKGGPGSGHYGHRGRPGKRGGSAPGVESLLRDSAGIASSLTYLQREQLAEALTRQPRVYLGHFGELEGIQDAPYDPDYPSSFWGTLAVGLYHEPNKVISVHPRVFDSSDYLQTVATHELGHHLVNTRSDLLRAEHYHDLVVAILTDKYADPGKGFPAGEKLADIFGLRYNSLTNSAEMLADAYLVWNEGSSEQQRELRDLLKPNVDIAELFQP